MSARRLAILLWGLAAALFAAIELARGAGLVINRTASAPRGLWIVEPLAGVERGRMVLFCPPDAGAFRLARERGYLHGGRCPGGYEPLLKPVAAVAGDLVEASVEGVAVNGRLVPKSAPLSADGRGRALEPAPAGVRQVAEGEVWLLSTYDQASFDSRYFGPVSLRQVEGQARPLWVEGDSPVSRKGRRDHE